MVSLEDGAIDKENSDITKYQDTYDMKHLKFKTGESPTIFHVKNMTEEDQAEIQDAHYKIKMPDQKMLHGEELKNAKPTIETVDQTKMILKYFYKCVEVFEEDGKEQKLEKGMFPFTIVQELGSQVMVRTMMGDEEKKL